MTTEILWTRHARGGRLRDQPKNVCVGKGGIIGRYFKYFRPFAFSAMIRISFPLTPPDLKVNGALSNLRIVFRLANLH